MRVQAQRGVALVITLVMLAVVTFMAVTFLAVSRRERSAVTVTEEQATAREMADTALQRAQSEIISRMYAQSNLLAYDMFVSTNFLERMGFDPGQRANAFNFTNVSYDFRQDGRPLTQRDQLVNLTNLLYDPRAPVFIRTNDDPRSALEFRFWLDCNRNGRFETNGLLPLVSPNNRFYELPGLTEVVPVKGGAYLSNFFVGDPEWIGVLQEQDYPHSPTNRFIGRFAYLVVPEGKNLDLNYIHNHALNLTDTKLSSDGYYRNQGFGSWELNLGAFLRDLNTNLCPTYSYRGLDGLSTSDAAYDALCFLRHRYGRNLTNLLSARDLFGTNLYEAFRYDFIDGYSDGPKFTVTNLVGLSRDDDLEPPTKQWAGSHNPAGHFDLQELWNTNKVIEGARKPGDLPFLVRLAAVQARNSSYDRYSVYRLLSQMGMDSAPASRDKINLNYNNLSTNNATKPVSTIAATNFIHWRPEEFFTNTAERLLQACRWTNFYVDPFGRLQTNHIIGDTVVRSGCSVTNILLYPVSEYSTTVHRLLQVAANLYDATTNRSLTAYPHLPSVFRPIYRCWITNVAAVQVTNIAICGYVPANDVTFLGRPFYDLNDPATRAMFASNRDRDVDVNLYGVPLVIGAKKGLPNFNEFSLLNVAQVSRRLELRKRSPSDAVPYLTNQMYQLCLSNQFGIETWNSYTQDFKRSLELRVVGHFMLALSNTVRLAGGAVTRTYPFFKPYAQSHTNYLWRSNQFLLPIYTNVVSLPESIYRPTAVAPFSPSTTNAPFDQGLGFYVPQWDLLITNRFFCALIDRSVNPNRLVDFATFANLTATVNVTRELAGQAQVTSIAAPPEPGNVWLTNRYLNATSILAPTEGVFNQMEISLGNIDTSQQQWTSYSLATADGLDKPKSIDHLRAFIGISPIMFYTNDLLRLRLAEEMRGKIAYQAGFSPIRKLYQQMSWQVNDPLVHYAMGDLTDPQNPLRDPLFTNSVRFAVPPQVQPTNYSNLGLLNEVYNPWGGNPRKSSTNFIYEYRVKDAAIMRSDDWQFPTNKFPNIGWIGRVHRGTPWQTIYLKSALLGSRAPWGGDTNILDTTNWFRWSGSFGSHPTNDWRFVEVFTVAPNHNGARGLLSVNQSGLAAWSAALSGVSVLSDTNRDGTVTEYLVRPNAEANSPQLEQIVDGINRTRALVYRGVFNRMGDLLATPELTFASPFIGGTNVNDFILERIPQQVLSLLKPDEPRLTIYAFGQSLREAPNSVYLGSGPFYLLCTNYQIRAESAVKAVVRVEGTYPNLRLVVEGYNELPVE